MKVGIIGAGRIGGGLAGQLAGPGVTAGSPADAVAFGEVAVISVPWSALPLALEQAGSLAGKIVIGTTNQFGPPPLPAAGCPGRRGTLRHQDAPVPTGWCSEEYRLPDAMAVVEAVRAGFPIPPTPQYGG